MGIHDRPYMQDDDRTGSGGGGMRMSGMQMGLPKITPGIKVLLIINIAAFVLDMLVFGGRAYQWFGAIPALWWQVWRYLTFQFLHGDPMHILFNMLALYFLGGYLESTWGTRRFIRFYLICGVVAGLTHVLFTAALGMGPDLKVPLIGASGGVYAVLIACAILFPHIKLLLMFFLPVPIRIVVAIFLGIAVFNMLLQVRIALEGGGGLGVGVSHAAHFGGALAGAVWVWVLPRIRAQARQGFRDANQGRWEKKMQQRAAEEAEVNRILTKIKTDGINALTRREKKTLKDATERQRREER